VSQSDEKRFEETQKWLSLSAAEDHLSEQEKVAERAAHSIGPVPQLLVEPQKGGEMLTGGL
jgi:hypothetical protein